ncbi:hypothetical protein EOA30_17580 [Mesorhizobium sp. M8A.F.Ca.ET.059.01.1.1]|nr:hypothetical protein EOA30_17580 [Mesorhizobium sp. M8A.F.Ca.ET.059.01.1.1]
MRFEPTLIVKRLVIKRNSHTAYDEKFHVGVNVIRGENSSGKSTILNFIFYGLGGDLFDWSEHAKLCSRVYVEIDINGNPATLARDVSVERGQPMEIFGGDFDAGIKAPRDAWIRYPYARSQSKESFSQAIFRLLGIPEVANELSGNITINQILRLLYADQLSPVENLFKFDSLFDSPVIRDGVGRLLSGAYDNALYQNEIFIRSSQREFDSSSAELRSLYSILGKADQSINVEWLSAQRRNLTDEHSRLTREIEEAERESFEGSANESLTLEVQERAYTTVQDLQSRLGELRDERDSLSLNIADSAAYIEGLRSKISALGDASEVAKHVGHIDFHSCPACYATLEEANGSAEYQCRLCKTPFDSERSRSRIVGLINDAALQLKQSEALQQHRLTRLEELAGRVREVQAEWTRAAARLSSLQRTPTSASQDRLRALSRRSGYIESQLEQLDHQQRLVEQIAAIQSRTADLNARIATLKSQNEALRAAQQKRLAEAYTAIAEEIRVLLRNDLRRQDSFEDPQSVEFDFGTNRISVDGQTYFSASSRVILKSSFFLGFLAAATKKSFFRHPRFCIIDTIEDKGMEPQRSHNFQMQIARVSEESRVEHQIIFATAMIAPQLDEPQFTIGKFSTRDDPTLAIS